MLCSFSKEFSSQSVTNIDNIFIKEYMPLASGNAVKVYLYGLFLCNHSELNTTIEDFSKELSLTENEVKECFKFWEEFGILSIIDYENFSVVFYPFSNISNAKPRKYKTDKYSEFSKTLQSFIQTRMISTSEYSEYFNIMETYAIKPEAMLMIVKYCIDRKGQNIGYRYISKVAKDFGMRGIISVDKVEEELSSYISRTAEIETILKALSLKRQPEIEDLNFYKKWTEELSFELDNIVFAAKALKKGSMEKLDEFLKELYSMKSFSEKEIKQYIENRRSIYELAIKINKALAIYVEIIDTEVDEYVKKWITNGFTDKSLLLVATYLFRNGKNTLQYMDEILTNLRNKGFIDFGAISDYFENEKRNDEFLFKMLVTCGLSRRPTNWDRENYSIWKTWNFSDEMIYEAAKLSSGKNSPIAYMNAILSSWKNKNIYSIENATVKEETVNSQEEYNREYSRRREIAVTRAQKNIEKAMEIEGFNKIYERLFGIEKDLAFAEISNDKNKLNQLECEKTNLTENANKLLKTISLNLADLVPHYACNKCKDTGYIGTHRCDCYDKKVN